MNSQLDPPLLTIVIPVYNETESIEQLLRELFSVLKQMAVTWEVIFVDDGSKDQSFEALEKARMRYDDVALLRFKHNF